MSDKDLEGYELRGAMRYVDSGDRFTILAHPDSNEILIELRSKQTGQMVFTIDEADRLASLLQVAVNVAKEDMEHL